MALSRRPIVVERIKEHRVAVLGIGNLRVGPAIVGALATYFGERHIEVALFDPDLERLELFARFCHVAFKFNKSPHDLEICEDAEDALAASGKVIFAFDDAASRRFLRQRGADDTANPTEASREILMLHIENGAALLDITIAGTNHGSMSKSFPRELTEEETRALPHQILRWVRGEEYLHEFFAEHEKSPIKAWLEGPESALLGEN